MSLNSTGNFEHEFNSERIYDGLDSSSLARLLIQALDNSADPMLVWDSEDRLIALNKAMVEISDQLSFTPKAGQTLTNFMATYSKTLRDRELTKRLLSRNESESEMRISDSPDYRNNQWPDK